MKGIKICESPFMGSHYVRAVEVKETDYTFEASITEDATVTLSGYFSKSSQAKCSKKDTYDFETGALIALMKMCGREKALKAVEELYLLKEPRGADLDGDVLESKVEYVLKENKRLEEEYIELREVYDNLFVEKEKLQHDYDLCENSENALKCSVNYLNKSIAKLNTAIYGYKNDLYNVSKRCKELEEENEKLKLDCEKLQHGYIDTDMIFCGGRQNGKQYTFLSNLFKGMPKDKVDAAYKEAYNKWTGLYKFPTKRAQMWAEIFALHKESDVIIKVKKEDVNTFLHEIENKIPEITWLSTVKIFETKYTIGDIYEELKTCDTIYFRLSKINTLSYSSDECIYAFRGLKPIDYLPPMRWDLFKKGRKIVRITPENLDDFMTKCSNNLGCIIKPAYKYDTHVFIMMSDYHYDNKPTLHIMSPEDLVRNQHENSKKYSDKKIVDWEDVR